MAIVAISISPTGAGEGSAGASVGRYVARAIEVARAQEVVRVEPGAMFTTLEGDLDAIFALVRRMQDAVFEAGAVRVGTVLKIDDRRDREVRIEDKIRSLEEKLP